MIMCADRIEQRDCRGTSFFCGPRRVRCTTMELLLCYGYDIFLAALMFAALGVLLFI